MKTYESVIIINSSLSKETLNRIVDRYEELIKKKDGTLRSTNRWGKRRLAYPIKKFQYGYYIIFDFESSSELVNELEREYRLNEHILRFMTLHKDKKMLLAEQRQKEYEANKAKEEAEQAAEKQKASTDSKKETAATIEEATEQETADLKEDY